MSGRRYNVIVMFLLQILPLIMSISGSTASSVEGASNYWNPFEYHKYKLREAQVMLAVNYVRFLESLTPEQQLFLHIPSKGLESNIEDEGDAEEGEQQAYEIEVQEIEDYEEKPLSGEEHLFDFAV